MKRISQKLLLILLPLLLIAGDASAGGVGGAFIKPLLDWLIELLKGYGGNTLAIMALLVALIASISGATKMLLIALVVAVGSYYGPDILMAISSATVIDFNF